MDNIPAQFNLGDRVEIVNYGHLIWESKQQSLLSTKFPVLEEDENVRWLDIRPDFIGKQATVVKVRHVQGFPRYSLHPIGSWFTEGQMKLTHKLSYTEI